MNKDEEMLEELRRIAKLLALSLVRNEPSERGQIVLLNRYGYQPKEISELLQINENTVRSNLFRARLAKAKKNKKS